MAPIRVLQIVPAMNVGGMETFIMNVYRHIDRKKVQFDFLTHYKTPGFYDAEILSLGGKIYYLPVREDNNFSLYFRMLDHFFRMRKHKIIHGHYSGFGLFYNHYAKKHGIQIRIGHSHSAGHEKSLVGLFDRILSSFFKYGVTKAFSCGQNAGNKLFGAGKYELLQNGIDLDSFLYQSPFFRGLCSFVFKMRFL